MASALKLSLLALASTAVAVPHVGHGRFHGRSLGGGYGYPTGIRPVYPTGGWGGNQNSTSAAGTGTGVATDTEETSTIYSTTTVYLTLARTSPKTSAAIDTAEAAKTSNALEVGEGGCGPATVTVTATNKVTVTVGASDGAVSALPVSSGPVAAPSEAAPVTPVESSPAKDSPTLTISIPNKEETAPVEEAPTTDAPKPVEPTAAPTFAPEPTTVTPEPTLAPAPTQESSAAPSSVQSSAPVSSSAPSGSPTYSGAKRGLAYNAIDLISKFSGKFGWAMNWAETPVPGKSAPAGYDQLGGAKFIPMMHNPLPAANPSTPEKFLQHVSDAVKQGSSAVMGFNEVDQEGQAKMSTEDACKYWAQYMQPVLEAHPEVTLIGPSVTNGPAPMGLDWLRRFKKDCPSASYHVEHIHFYDVYNEKGPSIEFGTADRFIRHVNATIHEFGKPVFVSEFGLIPGSTQEQSAKFLKDVLPYLDGEEKVLGYAYFMVADTPLGLVAGDGLSAAGMAYSQ